MIIIIIIIITIMIIIIIVAVVVVVAVVVIIIIATYVWVKGTREQVPQSSLSNNEGRSKKMEVSRIIWNYITRKQGYGHDDFKSLALKDKMNLL